MNQFVDDRDDDPRLPSRGSERRSAAQEHLHDDSDREFTLSTGTVLGLFFALALLCAVFFGFGYTLGHKSGLSSAEAAAVQPPPVVNDTATPKPSPASPVIQAIPGYQSSGQPEGASRTNTAVAPRTNGTGSTSVVVPIAPPPAARSTAPANEAAATPKPAPVVRVPTPVVDRPVPSVTAAAPTPAPVAGTGTTYVQIAAVSHQEDANVLLSALRRRGYTVFTRPGDSDKLIHVQVGPFATRKDADAMRERLHGDGYNAIIK